MMPGTDISIRPFIKNSLAGIRIPNSPYGSLYLDEREAWQGFVGQCDDTVSHLRVVHQNIVEICWHWERKGKSKRRFNKTWRYFTLINCALDLNL